MAPIPEIMNLISQNISTMIDFAVEDETLSADFEQFLTKNNINIQKQSDIENCLIGYVLDEKMQNNTRVLDYFMQKNPDCNKKIINALKNSFISIFKINKILKNAYSAYCLANEKDFELIPLVKMVNLRSIGLYDFIKARMIESDGVFYLLEIFECFGEFREYNANIEAVKCLIKYPKSQIMYNDEKLKDIKTNVEKFYKKFIENFECDEIVTSNTLADGLLKELNGIIETDSAVKLEKGKYCINNIEPGFFEIKGDDDFLNNAAGGFSTSKEPYNVGFFMDKDSGLYIIPFLGTFNEILKVNSLDTIKGAVDCIKYIMASDKVSPNLIIKKANEYKNFIPLISKVFDLDFKDIREIIGYFKADWQQGEMFSPIISLYNSKAFEKIIDIGDNRNKYR